MSRDPTLEEDIDTMRDVYMSTKQREAYERIVNRAARGGKVVAMWIDDEVPSADTVLADSIRRALRR